MVADDDVHVIRVQMLLAGNLDLPRVDFHKQTSQMPEPAPGSQSERILVKYPDHAQHWCPQNYKSRTNSPNPD